MNYLKINASGQLEVYRLRNISQLLSDPSDLLHYWSFRDISRNSGLICATLLRTVDAVQQDFYFNSNGFLDRDAVLAWAGASAVTVVRIYNHGVGTTNAIQTTILNMPPLDLTSSPLRIGAAAGTTLVATMPEALTNVWVIGNNDAQKHDIPAGEFIVHDGATEFTELAIISGDVEL